jgi:hypothetical protein
MKSRGFSVHRRYRCEEHHNKGLPFGAPLAEWRIESPIRDIVIIGRLVPQYTVVAQSKCMGYEDEVKCEFRPQPDTSPS